MRDTLWKVKVKMSEFTGFEPSNTTPVPDVLFDELLTELSGAELKVVLYIIRRTRGFKKDTDAISLNQFQKGIKKRDGTVLDKGCGIKDRQTIVNAIDSLEDKKCIESIKSKTASGDNDVTRYRIRFKKVVGNSNHLQDDEQKGGRENLPPWLEKPTTVVGNSNRGSMENPTRVVGNSNPQETVLQQTVSQETVRQHHDTQDSNIQSNITAATQTSTPTPVSPQELTLDQIRQIVEAQGYTLQPKEEIHPPSVKGVSPASVEMTPPTGLQESDTLNLANNRGVHTPLQSGGNSRQTVPTEPPGNDALSSSAYQSGSTNAPPSTKPTRTTRGRPANTLTLQGQHIMEIYPVLKAEVTGTKRRPVSQTEENVKAANGLGEIVECDEDLKEVLRCIFDDKFLKEKNVRIDLDFVFRKYDGFLDKVDKLQKQASPPAPKPELLEEARQRAQANNKAQLEKILARKAKLQREKEEKQNGKTTTNAKATSNVGM
jgi:hypothetical protein